MKNFLYLNLLLLPLMLSAQHSIPDISMNKLHDPHQTIKISELYPLKNLALLDRDRKPSNENHWMLETVTDQPSMPDQFSSLVLIKQLEELNHTTPFQVEHNATLERFIRVYLKDRRENLTHLLGKAAFYFPVFEQYLDKFDLPLEIKYLAVVESALNPSAISPSGAKGLWQFMYGTGLENNLYIDSYVDERYDYIKSTQAACAYLQKLYTTFNDWDLALAAYNSGPANVQKAIQRAGGTRNYWEIRSFLPRETQSYVPAFYATLYLFSFADYHGLEPLKSGLFYYQTDTVHVSQPLSFETIQNHLTIDKELLQAMNPQYKKGVIPRIKNRPMILTLPVNQVARFIEQEEKLYGRSKTIQANSASHVIPVRLNNSYLVEEGDNLDRIAYQQGISIAQLKKWNGLQTNYLIAGQRLVVTDQNRYSTELVTDIPRPGKDTTVHHNRSSLFYTVEQGDTLFKISRKFKNVTIEQLRFWNNLEAVNFLKPGMVLQVQEHHPDSNGSSDNKS
jgi:membrane-bound lytic murein transglycosylase D